MNNSTSWFDNGNLYYEKRQYQQALDCYERHLELYPTDEPALYAIFKALYALGQYDDITRKFLDYYHPNQDLAEIL